MDVPHAKAHTSFGDVSACPIMVSIEISSAVFKITNFKKVYPQLPEIKKFLHQYILGRGQICSKCFGDYFWVAVQLRLTGLLLVSCESLTLPPMHTSRHHLDCDQVKQTSTCGGPKLTSFEIFRIIFMRLTLFPNSGDFFKKRDHIVLTHFLRMPPFGGIAVVYLICVAPFGMFASFLLFAPLFSTQ